MPESLTARDLLSRISVLDIRPSAITQAQSSTANRVLCFTPNLLHLVAPKLFFNTDKLWQPPAPVEQTPKPVFATVRDRKRHERNERRARQQALARFHTADASATAILTTSGGETDVESDELETPNVVDPSISATWQLYNLQTLNMGLYGKDDMVIFTQYISRHRLFRNLISLKLTIPELRIGQRKTFTNSKKGTAVIPVSASGGGGKQHSSVTIPQPEPARHTNELLALRGLKGLEECVLRTTDVPGMILAKDFEFLRRREDLQTTFFFPKRKYGMKSAEDEDDDNEEYVKERPKTETFWPKLTIFHVQYLKISPLITTSKLVEGIEQIRPG
ncbi:hypothetical protein BG015_005221, partial [Linnemannia schmuckeri]